jgi:hypothetical protein
MANWTGGRRSRMLRRRGGRDFSMKRLIIMFWLVLPICGSSVLLGTSARAFDLTGVWSSNAAECDSVFVKRGRTISFRKESDLHGSGFIVQSGRIRGKLASCRIKSRKQDGDMIYMVAGCATDIMLSDVEFALKIVDDNKIIRLFPGLPEMEYSYERCPIK